MFEVVYVIHIDVRDDPHFDSLIFWNVLLSKFLLVFCFAVLAGNTCIHVSWHLLVYTQVS